MNIKHNTFDVRPLPVNQLNIFRRFDLNAKRNIFMTSNKGLQFTRVAETLADAEEVTCRARLTGV
jgi:hypothetical protein